jgi:serine protease Do
MRKVSTISAVILLLATLTSTVGCKEFDADAGVAPEGTSEAAKTTQEGASSDPEEPQAAAKPHTRGGAATLDTSTLRRVPDVVEQALPGVVGISTTREVRRRAPGRFPFGPPPRRGPGEPEAQGMGSGVIVSDDGLVLTNNHVVEGADEIEVTLSNKKSYAADIVGTDAKTDLAVLRMSSPPDNLQPLNFGDSSKLRLGEGVIAIGNPFGLSSTVTMGIVSAQGRGNVGIAEYEDFIQTDAAINPGNSGGALINLDGELVGINTAILSRTGASNGIGFAIPSNMASAIMDSLVADGEVRRGYLGVLIQTVEPEIAEGLGLPENTPGVAISDVKPDSPADRSGLKRHDVITKVGDARVKTANELRNEVAFAEPGSTESFTLLRNGEEMTVDVELGELPVDPRERRRRGQARPDGDALDAIKGLQVARLIPQVRQRFDIPQEVEYGVLVAGVARGSTPARAGIRPGDVILEANREPIKAPSDLEQAVADAEADKLLLLVWRRGNTVFVPLPLD